MVDLPPREGTQEKREENMVPLSLCPSHSPFVSRIPQHPTLSTPDLDARVKRG